MINQAKGFQSASSPGPTFCMGGAGARPPGEGSLIDAYLLIGAARMKRVLMISDGEYETLRRLSFEQRLPIAELIRAAIDQAYGTNDEEIQAPGRKPEKKND